jgi:WD40 repeat protein
MQSQGHNRRNTVSTGANSGIQSPDDLGRNRSQVGTAIMAEFIGDVNLVHHTGEVLSVVFSPSCNWIASTADDGVRLLSFKSADLYGFPQGVVELGPPPPPLLHGRESMVLSLAYSSDSCILATGSIDGRLVLWSPNDQRKLMDVKNEKSTPVCGILSLAFSPDMKKIASISLDHVLSMWDVSSGKLLYFKIGVARRSKAMQPAFADISFSQDSLHYATDYNGNGGNELGVWNANDGSLLCRLGLTKWYQPRDKNRIRAVTFSPDEFTLASGSSDGSIRLWDYRSGRLLANFLGHRNIVTCMAFSRDSTLLASASHNGPNCIIVWEVSTGRKLKIIEDLPPDPDIVRSIAFTSEPLALHASFLSLKCVKTWNLKWVYTV